MKKILHLLLLPIVLATSCKKDVNDKVEFKWAKKYLILKTFSMHTDNTILLHAIPDLAIFL